METISGFFDNITIRRKHRKSKSGSESQSLDESDSTSSTNHTLDVTTNSLPDTNISIVEESEEIRELKTQIAKLSVDLQSAHNEIDKLTLNNSELSKEISILTGKNVMYKNMLSSLTCESPSRKDKHNKDSTSNKSYCNINDKTISVAALDQTHESSNTTVTAQIALNEKNPPTTQRKITKPKKKICFISNYVRHNLLENIEETFVQWDYCHYNKRNANIRNLTENVEALIKDFTFEDFCVIIIGETDFNTTKNYFEIISSIRNNLKKCLHTNVIICLPSYRLNASVYNSRIELFSNLLILDVETHKNAYWLDTNLDLDTYPNMYHLKTGAINRKAVSNIFKNISLFMNDIKNIESTITPETRSITEDFFRSQK